MRVLIVEDDLATRDVLTRGLREERCHVAAVGDGSAAEVHALDSSFDVIVLDVVLPDQDGITVCRRLRTRGVDTPILLLTGRRGIDDRVRGLDAGGDDYLAKPFAFEELLARLRALTRRGRTRALGAVLRYGPLELDQRDRVVKVDGTLVVLTGTELRLLEYLMRRAEAFVTRDELARRVWTSDISPDSNVIDVYIGYLRKKLKSAGPLLQTVRGVGYMLKQEGV